MRTQNILFIFTIIVGFGIYAIAKDEDSRKPAMTLAKRNGIVCAQDVSVRGAEERINGKLGGNETTLTLANKFGSITDGKIAGLTVNSVPDKQSPSGFTYVICAAVAGGS